MKVRYLLLLLLFIGCSRDNAAVKISPTNMIPVLIGSEDEGLTFPAGTWDNASATIRKSFAIGQTEVTNVLAAEIFQWALAEGYLSTSPGASNEVNSEAVRYGNEEILIMDYPGGFCKISFTDGRFLTDKGSEDLPVVLISFTGAVLLCNWLTEMEEGHADNVVYSLSDSNGIRADCSRTGYRLPSKEEWQLAGRWFGTDPDGRTDLVSRNVNKGDASLTEGYFWLPGSYASGASADYKDEKATAEVAVFYEKITGPYPEDAAPVGTRKPNALGVYDMSGNVREWCFNWSPDSGGMMYFLGGSWLCQPMYLQSGGMFYVHDAWYEYPDIGFRLCRTI